MWEPLHRPSTTNFRTMVRLDARNNPTQVTASDAQPNLANKNELGDVEEAVIGQWAGEDVGASDDDDE